MPHGRRCSAFCQDRLPFSVSHHFGGAPAVCVRTDGGFHAVQEVQEDGGNLWRNYPKSGAAFRFRKQKKENKERMPHSNNRKLKHPLFMQSIHEWTARVDPQRELRKHTPVSLLTRDREKDLLLRPVPTFPGKLPVAGFRPDRCLRTGLTLTASATRGFAPHSIYIST